MPNPQSSQKRLVHWLIIVFLVAISAIALGIDPLQTLDAKDVGHGLADLVTLLRFGLKPVQLAHVLAVALIAYLCSTRLFSANHPFSWVSLTISAIFSSFMVIGMSFASTNDFSFISCSGKQAFIAFLVLCGYWNIFYVCLKTIYEKLDSLNEQNITTNNLLEKIKVPFFPFCVIVILLFWLLLSLPFFPGSVTFDGRQQLLAYYGAIKNTLIHPYYSTLLMGCLHQIGQFVTGGDGYWGTFFITMFNRIAGAVVFGDICAYAYKKSGSLVLGLICLLFFAVAPMWWAYTQNVLKDTLFFIAFAWFALELTKIYFSDSGRFGVVRLTIAAVLCCSFRYGIIFVVLPAMLGLCLTCQKKRAICLSIIAFLLVNFALNTVLIHRLGLRYAQQQEALSIPLQQIARMTLIKGDNLTSEEKNIIDKVIPVDKIPQLYKPEISDPIKGSKRKGFGNLPKEDLVNLGKLWFEKFFEYPKIYVEAWLNHVYGYLYPFYFSRVQGPYRFYIAKRPHPEIKLIFSKYVFSEKTRIVFFRAALLWEKVPFLSFVVNPAFYTWLGIFGVGALVRKGKRKDLVLFVAPTMLLLICCASPVNGLLRYMLPIMATGPIILLISLLPYIQKENIPKKSS